MRRVACLGLIATVSSFAAPPGLQPSAGSPPAPPPYQMRAPTPPGDRLVAGRDGAALYSNRCGACHLSGGMGTNMLTRRRVMAGEPPESGLLTNRSDLSQTYVKHVVRHGKVAMPGLTRVEVTDAELDAIAKYLGRAGP
jgi:mono/diheme cytochrome c family protein